MKTRAAAVDERREAISPTRCRFPAASPLDAGAVCRRPSPSPRLHLMRCPPSPSNLTVSVSLPVSTTPHCLFILSSFCCSIAPKFFLAPYHSSTSPMCLQFRD
jgi:hypothetical protein